MMKPLPAGKPEVGAFAVVNTGTPWATPLIEAGEFLWGDGFSDYDHAVTCSAIRADGTVVIVEAMPHGAVEVFWHYQDRPHAWSTGRVKTSPEAGDAAHFLTGTPYSALDYFALAAHRLSLHPLDMMLRRRVASSKHAICSQLVDLAQQRAGVQLFDDQRWPGYVVPQDLALLIAG